MSITRKVEVVGGMVTGLLAIITAIIVRCPSFGAEGGGIGIYIGLALLVAIGSYAHAVRQKTVGLVMLLLGGILETVILIGIALLGGLFIFCGIKEGIMILTPSAPAIVTVIASLLTRRPVNSDPFECTVNGGKQI